MHSASRQALRKLLNKKEQEAIESLRGHLQKLVSGEIRQIISSGQDEGDRAVVQQYEYMCHIQFAAQSERIRQIDHALKKLDAGEYGFCEECREEISAERLRVIPFAVFCRDCQEAKEQRRFKKR
jgi:DnaK suppressor protein